MSDTDLTGFRSWLLKAGEAAAVRAARLLQMNEPELNQRAATFLQASAAAFSALRDPVAIKDPWEDQILELLKKRHGIGVSVAWLLEQLLGVEVSEDKRNVSAENCNRVVRVLRAHGYVMLESECWGPRNYDYFVPEESK